MSRSKTEYLRVGGVDDGEKLKLQGEKTKTSNTWGQQLVMMEDVKKK